MAYVTKNRSGRWEIRESRSTPAGPRSRTLASFEKLGHAHLELAATRSAGELDIAAVVDAARRAGAPVEVSPANEAAIALLRAIGDGDGLSPGLRRLLRDAIGANTTRPETEEALGHIGKSAAARGGELVDLLLFVDAIPDTGDRSQLTFPGIPSTSG